MPKEVATSRLNGEIARLAARQHGVITAGQLYEIGLSPAAISGRVAADRLHRIHRGVYAVGHPRISNEGRWMAAVLAVGDGAVLSHRSAARLWTIDPQERAISPPAEGAASETVDITVPAGGGRAQRSGIRLHRSRTLSQSDCTLRQGIPVTTPARTLQDLRHVLPRTQFAQAVRQATFHGLSIGNDIPTDHTRSELEARFLALLRRNRLPQPEVNVQVDRFVVDFLWRPQRLVVELDGWQSHRGREAFEEDRARDARLKLLDYEVLRFTWRQVLSAPAGVAATVQTLLRR